MSIDAPASCGRFAVGQTYLGLAPDGRGSDQLFTRSSPSCDARSGAAGGKMLS